MQCQAVVAASRYCLDIRDTGDLFGLNSCLSVCAAKLAEIVRTPAPDLSIAVQHKGMMGSCCKRSCRCGQVDEFGLTVDRGRRQRGHRER